MQVKSFVKLAVGILVSSFFTYKCYAILFKKGIDGSDLHVGFSGVACAVASVLVAYHFRVVRWQAMLSLLNVKVSFQQLYSPLYGGFALNGILPFRIGDIYRILAVERTLNIPINQGFTTLIVERILDVVSLLIILCLAGGLIDGEFSLFGIGDRIIFIFSAISISILLLVLPGAALLSTVGQFIKSLIFKKGFVIKVLDALIAITDNVRAYTHPKSLFKLILISLFIWLVEASVILYLLSTIHSLFAPFIASVLGNLGTLIPSTPGHIGTFDFFVKEGLLAFNYDPQEAAIVALIAHLCIWFPVTSVGLYYLFFVRRERLSKIIDSASI